MNYLLIPKPINNLSKFVLFSFIMTLMPFVMIGQDYSELYEKLYPSVVTILTAETTFTDGEAAQGGGLGTGVLVDAKGLVMTAAHVVASAEAIVVKAHDGKLYEAEVISSVSAADVALIKLKEVPKNIPVAKLGDSDAVKIGSQVLVIGAPFGLEYSLSIGHVSGKQKRGAIIAGEMMEFLQTDASINTGNSGGPIYNSKGEVIGIVSSILTKSGGFEGVGFAASINPTKKILLESSPFWTGFEGLFLEEHMARIFNVPAKGGVLVQRVVSGSVADLAGLRGGWLKANIQGNEVWVGGDVVMSVEHTACDTPHNFETARAHVCGKPLGDIVHLTVLRAGKKIELTMDYTK